MEIVPQSTRVLVEPIPEEGKIVRPDATFMDAEGNDVTSPIRWRVVALGEGRLMEDGKTIVPIPLKVGDEVVFDGRFATALTPPAWYGGKRYAMVEYGAILAKVAREPGESVSWNPPPVIKTARAVPSLARA